MISFHVFSCMIDSWEISESVCLLSSFSDTCCTTHCWVQCQCLEVRTNKIFLHEDTVYLDLTPFPIMHASPG